MFWKSVLAASVLAARARAGFDGAMEGALSGRTVQDLDRRLADVSNGFASEGYVPRVFAKRDVNGTTVTASSLGTGVVLNADGTINMTAWDNTASAACNNVLNKLSVSTNPSGTCVCYNLPALDNSTGTFEADLRLFQLSSPTGAFADIAPQDVQVGLSYPGASVSPVSVATASKLVVGRADTSSLTLLQQYLFVGQINKDMMSADMNMAQLEALVMPIITLTGKTATGQTVATNVSANEAAFVAGVFSNAVIMSNVTLANAAVNKVIAELNNGTIGFVLPGLQLILFPVGLVVISVWTVVGAAAIAFGFVERVSYREQYKRRAVQTLKGGTNRF